jgi:hypothetical protein
MILPGDEHQSMMEDRHEVGDADELMNDVSFSVRDSPIVVDLEEATAEGLDDSLKVPTTIFEGRIDSCSTSSVFMGDIINLDSVFGIFVEEKGHKQNEASLFICIGKPTSS